MSLARVAVSPVLDAPLLALAHAALDGKQYLAQPGGVHANGICLLEDVAALARGVEDTLAHGQHQGAGALSLGVSAQQGLVSSSRIFSRRSKVRTSAAGRAA